MNFKEVLSVLIDQNGPISCVKVSSAQARGLAKQYSYWGPVRCNITLSKAGFPVLKPLERAKSDRRSKRLAWEDAHVIATEENRAVVDRHYGMLSETECQSFVKETESGWGIKLPK